MKRQLRQIDVFASGWQCGRWRLADLPNFLRLRVVGFDDGGEVLGTSLLPIGGIGLSDRLEDSPLRLAIQTHECVHHLLRLSTTALCHTSWYPVRDELIAWLGAARLAVADYHAVELLAGRLDLHEVGEEIGVPSSLVGVGASVYAWLHGDRPFLGLALAAWCLEMQTLVAKL